MGLINKSIQYKYLLEYQRLVSEHTSFWSSFYKGQILDATSNVPFSWERRRHWKIEKGAEFSSAFSEQFRNHYVPPKMLVYRWKFDRLWRKRSSNTCPINTITASDSNYFVYVKVKVGINTIFLFIKASKAQEVNMEFHMTFV